MKKLFLLVFFLFASPCWATIALVAGSAAGANQASGTANLTVTMGANLAAGNTIICAVYDQAGNNETDTVSDGDSNTYHKDRSQNITTDADTFGIFHADNVVVSTQNPPQVKGTGTSITGIACVGFSGLATSSFDKTVSQDATGTAMTSTASATLSQANELIIGGMGVSYSVGGTPTITVGSGFTQLVSEIRNGSSTPTVYLEYQIVSSTTAIAATATYSTSVEYAGVVATYEGASGGSTPAMPAEVY